MTVSPTAILAGLLRRQDKHLRHARGRRVHPETARVLPADVAPALSDDAVVVDVLLLRNSSVSERQRERERERERREVVGTVETQRKAAALPRSDEKALLQNKNARLSLRCCSALIP